MGANVSNYAEYFNESVTTSIQGSSSASASTNCIQHDNVDCKHGSASVVQKCMSGAEASANVIASAISKLVNKVKTDEKNQKLDLGQVNVANTNINIDDGAVTKIQNLCSSTTNTYANQALNYTAENCGYNTTILNLGQAQAQCMYNIAMKTIMDASSQASISQSNDGISMFGIAMVIVAIIALIVVVFVVRQLLMRKGGRAGVGVGGGTSSTRNGKGGVTLIVK